MTDSSSLGLSEGDGPDCWWFPPLGLVADLTEDLDAEEHRVGRLGMLLEKLSFLLRFVC